MYAYSPVDSERPPTTSDRLPSVRSIVAVRRSCGPDGEPIRMATGVAELDPTELRAAEALLKEADEALMRAKGSGSFELPRARG